MNSARPAPRDPHTPARIFIEFWLPSLLWMALIATFSSAEFKANNSSHWLDWILRHAGLRLNATQFNNIHVMIRKGMHFFSYAMLSVLWFRSIRGPVHLREASPIPWRIRWMAFALAVCLATSVADEVHQMFTPGRTGTFKDSALDMAGALTAQVALAAWLRKSKSAAETLAAQPTVR